MLCKYMCSLYVIMIIDLYNCNLVYAMFATLATVFNMGKRNRH